MATLTVDLPADHPGYADPAYRARRAAIAEVSDRYQPGDAIPEVTYTAEFTFKGPSRLLAPLLRNTFDRLGTEAEIGMREALNRL